MLLALSLGVRLLARHQFELVAQLGDFLLQRLELVRQLQAGTRILFVLLLQLLAQVQDGPPRFVIGKSMGRRSQGGHGDAGGQGQVTQGENSIAHRNSRSLKAKRRDGR